MIIFCCCHDILRKSQKDQEAWPGGYVGGDIIILPTRL